MFCGFEGGGGKNRWLLLAPSSLFDFSNVLKSGNLAGTYSLRSQANIKNQNLSKHSGTVNRQQPSYYRISHSTVYHTVCNELDCYFCTDTTTTL